MFKRRRDLFERIRTLWPHEVRILIDETTENAVATEPCLWVIYQDVESSFDLEDNWSHLGAWSFHQALDKLGRRKAKGFCLSLKPSDVSFNSFNTHIISNMNDECWDGERNLWMELPD